MLSKFKYDGERKHEISLLLSFFNFEFGPIGIPDHSPRIPINVPWPENVY